MSNDVLNSERSPRHEIIALLSRKIGLNIDSIGDSTINRAITKALRLAGIKTEVSYLQKLKVSPQILQQLIECVVIPETSFFRNPESYTYLLKHIHANYKMWGKLKQLRVLSLPCSSGEEAYSIAMTLLEAGLEPNDFKVDGIDINQQGLSIAKQGIYGKYSFRNKPNFSTQYYLQKYFKPLEINTYSINSQIRSRVNFYQGNLLDFDRLCQGYSYDIIFCRNLLIYFHKFACHQALHNLHHLLAPSGLLFIGYAEAHHIDPRQFKFLDAPQAFVFQKIDDNKKIKEILKLPKRAPNIQPIKKKLESEKKYRIQIERSSQEDSKFLLNRSESDISNFSREKSKIKQEFEKINDQSSVSLGEISHIRCLANRGHLNAALEKCDTYLKSNPTSAEGYLLLGEVYQAQGSDERADIAFQRSLYLNPNCITALNYRLLLCEKRFDRNTAKQIRQRIIRLTQN